MSEPIRFARPGRKGWLSAAVVAVFPAVDVALPTRDGRQRVPNSPATALPVGAAAPV
ncbi:MAG: hypothetical protein IT340_15400 [Chloroflexi bacterium]|nr:hypothetical protein [Chloroflexota bacterium]